MEQKQALIWPQPDRVFTPREYAHCWRNDEEDCEVIHECEGNELSISGFGVKVRQQRKMVKLQLGPEFQIKDNETPQDHLVRMNQLLKKELELNHENDMRSLDLKFFDALRDQQVRIQKYLDNYAPKS